MRRERMVIFDLLRIVLVVIVVSIEFDVFLYGSVKHSIVSITSLAVPLFMVLSFYLNGEHFLERGKVSYELIKKRLKRIIFPLVFWSIIAFSVNIEQVSIENLIRQLVFGHVVNVPLYFLSLLFFYTIIFSVVTLIPNKIRIYIIFWTFLVAIFLEQSNTNFHTFNNFPYYEKYTLGRFVELIKFASIGLILYSYGDKLSALIKKSGLSKTLVLIFSILIALTINKYKSYLSSSGFGYSGFTTAMYTSGIFMLILLMRKIKFYAIVDKSLNFLGRYSFGIYCSHLIINKLLFNFFGDQTMLQLVKSVNHFFYVGTIAILSILVCFTIDKLSKGKLSFVVR